MEDMKIICAKCSREFHVPVQMLGVWDAIELKCKTCGSMLTVNTLKEQMRHELIKIMERSGYL